MSGNSKLFFCVVCIVTFARGIAKANDWKDSDVFTTRMEAQMFKPAGNHSAPVEYLLYLPKAYPANSVVRWPLLLYLHGAGERSTNVFGATWHGPPKLVRQGHDFPFIIVAPLCPPNQWWSDTTLLRLLDHMEKEYRVDTNRVYLTGMSMGGSGTWSLGLRQAKRFAAIAPICGNVNPAFLKKLTPDQIEAIKTLYVWAFHGVKDPTAPIAATERMIDALKQMGCTKLFFTKYSNADHDSWTATYNSANFYRWLLQHQRQP